MSKGLEALEIIKGALVEIEYDEEEDIILSAWQEHEEETNIIEKELKALEIIKNKEINVHSLLLHLKRFDSPEGYNALVGAKYQIIQEEWNLLKGVLL